MIVMERYCKKTHVRKNFDFSDVENLMEQLKGYDLNCSFFVSRVDGCEYWVGMN